MSFFVYLAVVLVSVCTILLEVNWLTRPKLEQQPAVASVAAKAPPAAARKVDGPSAALSPVYPTSAGGEEKQADAKPADAAVPNAAVPQATGAPLPMAGLRPTAVSPAAPTTPEKTAAPATTPQPVTLRASNSCDIPACTSAYRSFRASDCTYQPFEGSRQLCEIAPGAAQKAASTSRSWSTDSNAPPRSKADELRDVEREVRELTAPDDADADGEAAAPPRPRRVIVTEPGYARSWRNW